MDLSKTKILLTPFDKAIETIGWISLVLLIAIPVFYYSDLPSQIPSHFGANGKADDFSARAIIWLIPILGVFNYFLLYSLNGNTSLVNLPMKVTEENAQLLYSNTFRMMRVLNTLIVLIFVYIVYASVQTALGNQDGLGPYFMPLFLTLILGVTGYFTFRMKKLA